MKQRFLLLVGTALALAFSASSQANYQTAKTTQLSKDMEPQLIKICEAIQSNNRMKIKKAMDRARLDFRAINKGLKCNGMSPLSFAYHSKANSSVQLLAKHTNQQVLTASTARSFARPKQ